MLYLHLLIRAYVFPVLRLEFTALSWRDDLSLSLWARTVAAVVTSLAPRVKRHWGGKVSLSTLNLIAPWFDAVPPSAVCFYPIEGIFKEIKRCIHFSLRSHSYLIHVNQREAGRDHHNVPSSSYVWSLATENGLLFEAGSCAKRNISNADSLQRVAEQSVPIYFWFGRERRTCTG